MKMPIRNRQAVPLTLFVEPWCNEYEIPPGGEARIALEDGRPHSLEICAENFVILWDEGDGSWPAVEIFDADQTQVPMDPIVALTRLPAPSAWSKAMAVIALLAGLAIAGLCFTALLVAAGLALHVPGHPYALLMIFVSLIALLGTGVIFLGLLLPFARVRWPASRT